MACGGAKVVETGVLLCSVFCNLVALDDGAAYGCPYDGCVL